MVGMGILFSATGIKNISFLDKFLLLFNYFSTSKDLGDLWTPRNYKICEFFGKNAVTDFKEIYDPISQSNWKIYVENLQKFGN